MPDLVLDYALLRKLGTQVKEVSEKFDQANGTKYGAFKLSYETTGCNALDYEMEDLQVTWTDQLDAGKKEMAAFAEVCLGLAQAWFETDAQAAAEIGAQNANYLIAEYEQRKAAREQAQWLKDHPYRWSFTDHTGKTYEYTIDLWDPDRPLPEVGAPNGDYFQNTPDGGSVHTKINPDGSATTWVNRPDGMNYAQTSNTVRDENTGVVTNTTSVVHADGSTDSTVTKINPDGSGSMVVTGGEDGPVSYSRGPGGTEWVKDPASEDE
ncbi:hypothetical protein OG216_39660 [Streptomycetaceae bacterium NBC_01309]